MQKSKLKEIIEQQHKKFYDPLKATAARGFRKAALEEMHAFYPNGTADHIRIKAFLTTEQQIANFISNHMVGGTKGKYSRHA